MTKYAVFLSTGPAITIDCASMDGTADGKLVLRNGEDRIIGEFSRASVIGWCEIAPPTMSQKDPRKEALQ